MMSHELLVVNCLFADAGEKGMKQKKARASHDDVHPSLHNQPFWLKNPLALKVRGVAFQPALYPLWKSL